MVLGKRKTGWQILDDKNLATILLNFDKESVSAEKLSKIRRITRLEEY